MSLRKVKPNGRPGGVLGGFVRPGKHLVRHVVRHLVTKAPGPLCCSSEARSGLWTIAVAFSVHHNALQKFRWCLGAWSKLCTWRSLSESKTWAEYHHPTIGTNRLEAKLALGRETLAFKAFFMHHACATSDQRPF